VPARFWKAPARWLSNVSKAFSLLVAGGELGPEARALGFELRFAAVADGKGSSAAPRSAPPARAAAPRRPAREAAVASAFASATACAMRRPTTVRMTKNSPTAGSSARTTLSTSGIRASSSPFRPRAGSPVRPVRRSSAVNWGFPESPGLRQRGATSGWFIQSLPGTATSPEDGDSEGYGGDWALHRSVVELSKPSRKIPWDPTGLAWPS
jgi:hypothetical protein